MNEHHGNRALVSVPGVLALAMWSVYLLLALNNLPDFPHRVLISGFFGLLACVAVVANFRYWRIAVLLASSVYLLVYVVLATRMAMMVMDLGKTLPASFCFYYSTSWQVTLGKFQERGLAQGLSHAYLEYAMPTLSVLLLVMILLGRRRKPDA